MTLALWHADHVNFGRLLNLLENQFVIFHDGDSPDYTLMLDIIYYMTRYSDVVHHPKEDCVFEIIKKRELRTAQQVDALCGQHAALGRAASDLARDLDDIVNGTITARERVEKKARDYVRLFRDHMRMEETEMLPLAARLLNERDWSGVDEAVRHMEDPLFGPNTEARFVALRDEIRREAQLATHREQNGRITTT